MNIIHVYTDGSWNTKDKHMGIGIYAKFKSKEIRYSKYIGTGTGNIAELTAIKIALHKLTNYKKHRIKIISDSQYCIGMLSKKWKAKANKELLAEIKDILDGFNDVRFEWVRGHDKSYGNIQADSLALDARKSYENTLTSN